MILCLQLKTRVDAVSAHPSTLRAVRNRQQQTEQRVQQLLQEHFNTEGKRLQAVRRRQRLLQKAVSELRAQQQSRGLLSCLQSVCVSDCSAPCTFPKSAQLHKAAHSKCVS
jgi:hypothetical protein